HAHATGLRRSAAQAVLPLYPRSARNQGRRDAATLARLLTIPTNPKGEPMPTPLCVRADAHSILRNILNYFSDNFACIQELLQNTRRAEASEVRVDIDTRAGTVTVT